MLQVKLVRVSSGCVTMAGIPMRLGGNGASEELGSPLKLRYKMLPNRIQMRNISRASVVVAGHSS